MKFFGINNNLSITMDDGLEVCNKFMENARPWTFAPYGLEDAKLQIMQMMGQWININPSAMGTAIAIKGPMGTGKTTLVRDD